MSDYYDPSDDIRDACDEVQNMTEDEVEEMMRQEQLDDMNRDVPDDCNS